MIFPYDSPSLFQFIVITNPTSVKQITTSKSIAMLYDDPGKTGLLQNLQNAFSIISSKISHFISKDQSEKKTKSY
jgi:hypothetical protein